MHLTILICQKMFSKRVTQNTEKQQNTDKIVVTQNFFESSLKLRKAPAHLIPGFHLRGFEKFDTGSLIFSNIFRNNRHTNDHFL